MKDLIKYFKFTAATFLFLCFLYSFVIWFNDTHQTRSEITDPLSKYTKNHEDEIKNVIFGEIFSQAKSCLSQPTEKLAEACQKEVTAKLAKVVIEEELLNPSGYYWPHELMFVKQQGDNLYTLSWNGKLNEIPNQHIIKDRAPYFMQVLTGNCRTFKTYTDICDTYTTVDLGNNQTGYLVREIPLGEEGSLSLQILLLFLFPARYKLELLTILILSIVITFIYSKIKLSR